MWLEAGGKFVRRLIALFATVALAAGCTTTSESFYKDPSKADKTSLCRAYIKSTDEPFRSDVRIELNRRGVDVFQCTTIVRNQNTAIAAAAIVAVAAAGVAVCANNGNCAGGGAYSGGADWDQFYDKNYRLVWACREIYTGRFTYASNCAGKYKSDHRWPSKSA